MLCHTHLGHDLGLAHGDGVQQRSALVHIAGTVGVRQADVVDLKLLLSQVGWGRKDSVYSCKRPELAVDPSIWSKVSSPGTHSWGWTQAHKGLASCLPVRPREWACP